MNNFRECHRNRSGDIPGVSDMVGALDSALNEYVASVILYYRVMR